MAFSLAFEANRPAPAAVLGFSGFIPNVDGFELDLAKGTPVAIGHGTYDPVIEVEFGREARTRLEAAGTEVLYREYPLPHAIDPDFVHEVAGALNGWVPGRAIR
jgi:phospholipase/carboxylesterase